MRRFRIDDDGERTQEEIRRQGESLVAHVKNIQTSLYDTARSLYHTMQHRPLVEEDFEFLNHLRDMELVADREMINFIIRNRNIPRTRVSEMIIGMKNEARQNWVRTPGNTDAILSLFI